MTTELRRNERSGTCTECRGDVPAGEGRLWWEPGPDDGGITGQPAGWRVTHLDASKCMAVRAAQSDDRAAKAAAGKAARDAAMAAFAEEKARVDAPAFAAIAEHKLVEAPAQGCTLRFPFRSATVIYSGHYTVPGTGFSGTTDVTVLDADGEIAVRFLSDGSARHFVSQTRLDEGLAWFRLHRFWTPEGYNADSYPGPKVPDAELTDEELKYVNRLRAAALAAKAAERWRQAEIIAKRAAADKDVVRFVEQTGGTVVVEISNADAVKTDNAHPELLLRFTVPAHLWHRGKLRAPIAKLLPRNPSLRFDLTQG